MIRRRTRCHTALTINPAELDSTVILTPSTAGLKAEIARRVPQTHRRDMVFAFVDRWQKEVRDLPAEIYRSATIDPTTAQ
jgi:hypothetical protein